MIYPIIYGGKGEKIIENGKKEVINLPSFFVLESIGPFIEVVITHPEQVQKELLSINKEVPSIKIKALIDTGARSCVITPAIAKKLNLKQTGFKEVTSVQNRELQPEYYGCLLFPWGSRIEIQIVSCPLTGIDGLIGREVLRHWYLTYNGLNGSLVICD